MNSGPDVSKYEYLEVCPGDLVVVTDENELLDGEMISDWWLGYVIHSTCGARNPDLNSLFQIADVDTGQIRTINADLVKGILRPRMS